MTWLALLLLAATGWGKKSKLYHCQQADGTVVIQDRRCSVTGLQKQTSPVATQKPKSQLRQPPRAAQVTAPKIQVKKPKLPKQKQNSLPRNNQQWQSAIPANWQMFSQKRSLHEQWWFSQSPMNQFSDFKQGVKVSLYKDTQRSDRKGAFAQALALYHAVRNDPENQLLDSGFKNHKRYKVFNIKYMRKQHVMLSEYYVDEHNDQLYVLTIQAKQSQWQAPQQLAATIMRAL